MKIFKYLFLTLLLAVAFGRASAQQVSAQTDIAAWPPSQAVLDTMNMRMAVIKGLPDSVAVRNPGVFVNKIDDDEWDVYVLNKLMYGLSVRATMLSPNPDIRGRAKAYAKILMLDMEGKAVKTVTASQGGTAVMDVTEMAIPDGVYRVRVDYGGKHTKDGTKPKSRLELFVSARVSLDKDAARAGGDHLRMNIPPRR